MFALLCFALFVMEPAFSFRHRVAGRRWLSQSRKMLWYVEQILGFSSKGSVCAARARLKFVAGKESVIGQNVKKRLLSDGVNADTFHYFVESVEVDCKKKLFTISRIDFFDAEDAKIFGQTFAEPKQYPSRRGALSRLSPGIYVKTSPLLSP